MKPPFLAGPAAGALVGALVGPWAAPGIARAQAACAALADPDRPAPAVRLAPPLNRVVPGATGTAAVPLRTALDRLAAAAGVRLSYSRELLPLDRLSCPTPARAPLGIALAQLLQGTGVQPVGVGDDQVVLAPALAPFTPATAAAPTAVPTVAMLEQVVVTGSATGAPSRRLPFALDVVDGPALGASASAPLVSALDGRVPGLWLWAQPPTAVLTRFGSLRGASSFGVSAPKLYLDGIEAANPLVVTELPPERVARVEVTRGPQGAALYGADAISGVINVVTRHDGASETGSGGRTVIARGGVGGAGSNFAGRPAVAQDYAVLLRTGGGARTAGASFSASTLGPYTPGAATRRLTATGDLRRVDAGGTVTATVRLADAATSTPTNPLLSALLSTATSAGTNAGGTSSGAAAPAGGACSRATLARQLAGADLPGQRLQQLTAGVTATRVTGTRWTHAFTAGVDGYRLRGVATDLAPVPISLDSAQRAAQGGAARATLRASSTATLDVSPRVRATVMALADYGLLRDATADGALLTTDTPGCRSAKGGGNSGPGGGGGAGGRGLGGGDYRPGGSLLAPGALRGVAYLGTAGLVGQATLAVDDALFLTAGLRGERNDGFTQASRFAALPSVGAAYVRAVGPATTVKVRAAYGSGLRPARTATRATTWRGAGAVNADLEPESQRGVEAGVDLYVDATRRGPARGFGAPTAALHVTRFDQRAVNLLQQVAVAPGGWAPPPTALDSARRGPRRLAYALENVGVIRNQGWELAGDARTGPLALAATLSFVDSRVRQIAATYTGDLRAGDRMLEVPRRTAGVTAAWQHAGWTASLGAARASDWINYDRLRLALVSSNTTTATRAFLGDSLRAYWRRYPGVTRLNASAARDLRRGFTLVLTGDNLLDRQFDEPDNATVVPGRTVTLGVRARF